LTASSPLKKGTFFFSGAIFAVFLRPEEMDVPFFNGLLAGRVFENTMRRPRTASFCGVLQALALGEP
jgi:hypothetical protein